jgi:hypothetical protein
MAEIMAVSPSMFTFFAGRSDVAGIGDGVLRPDSGEFIILGFR